MKLLGEIKIHKSMDHPNIVRQRDCFEDDVNVYMILDICTNGTLMDMLRARKRFTEPEVRYFGIQILGAVKYMHSRRVIHRDLKLGNLFLDEDMCIKVGDFGLAALLVDDDDRKKTFCGTPNYIAPEVLFGSGEGHSYEVDLWGIGVIFYAMLVGKPPFQSKDVKAIYAKIKTNEYDFPSSAEVSEDARNLITSLLCTDPQNRPTIDDIANHEFFNHGMMPRSIPPSAIKLEPRWPEGQASSIFKRNLNYVSINAGIGQDRFVGREQGQVVDIKVELPERGKYLPISLSPRTGPAAKMLNLKDERAGGRRDTLSERLKSVQLEPETEEASPSEHHRSQNIETRSRALQRTTVMAGVHRSQKENVDPEFRPYQREKTRSALSGAVRAPAARMADTSEESKATSLRPRGATRVVSEPTRPITRSSRFTQFQSLTDVHADENGEARATNKLSGPMRRAASANIPVVRPGHDLPSRALPVRPVSCLGRRGAESPDSVSQSSSRATSDQAVASSSKSTKSIDNRLAGSNAVPRAAISSDLASDEESVQRDVWGPIRNLAELIKSVLAGLRVCRERQFIEANLIHVSKWVDYSHRYGLGYQLSNDSTGVYFNDATSIILPSRSSRFDIIASSGSTNDHLIDSPPRDLEKKVSLLKYFRGYMSTHLNNTATDSSSSLTKGARVTENCYMTHYWRTKAGMLFRLSDGTLQLNFTDHSKLMMPQPVVMTACIIRYVSVDKVTTTRSLGSAIKDPECREKIDCAAKILQNFCELEGRAGEAGHT